MNKLKVLLPVILLLVFFLALPVFAEEAENLTANLNVKVVDQPGKIKNISLPTRLNIQKTTKGV